MWAAGMWAARSRAPVALFAAALVLALPLARPLVAEPLPAPAATAPDGAPALSAGAFDALTRGRTMDTAGRLSGPYGVETFLPGHRVIWRDAQRCVHGHWEEVQGQICFTYDGGSNSPVCWIYVDRGGWIEGFYQGPRSHEPVELREGKGPVGCDGWLGA